LEVNLGQRPFRFTGLNPPAGWCLYDPATSVPMARGPPIYGHIEGYYRDVGGPCADALVLKDAFGDDDRFEVTLARLTPNKAIAVGVGVPGAGLACGPGSLAVQCDDGMMVDGGHPPAAIFAPQLIEEGTTIGIGRKSGRFEFLLNASPFDLPTRQELSKVHAMVVARNANFYLFVNAGRFPFASAQDGDTMLFNRARVAMTEEGLGDFGLMRDDVVEARDRQFIGKVLGMFGGRPFFHVPGIVGAVCLNSADPIFHRMLLRVVSRPRVSHFFVPVLMLDGVQRVNVGVPMYSPMSIVAAQFGVGLFVGNDPNGRHIVRPIVDLISSANCIWLPGDIRKLVVGSQGVLPRFRDIQTNFFAKHSNLWPLDITDSVDSSLCVVLGYRADSQVVGFDGTKTVDVQSSANPRFRFVGLDRGILFGQSMLYSVSIIGFVTGGIFGFTNEFCGAYGCHVVLNQTEKPSMQPLALVAPLPPYVDRILKSLCDEKESTLTKVKLPHSPEDDLFYECEIPDDAPRIADIVAQPGLLVDLDSEH
jgi:hypothetical protein